MIRCVINYLIIGGTRWRHECTQRSFGTMPRLSRAIRIIYNDKPPTCSFCQAEIFSYNPYARSSSFLAWWEPNWRPSSNPYTAYIAGLHGRSIGKPLIGPNDSLELLYVWSLKKFQPRLCPLLPSLSQGRTWKLSMRPRIIFSNWNANIKAFSHKRRNMNTDETDNAEKRLKIFWI